MKVTPITAKIVFAEDLQIGNLYRLSGKSSLYLRTEYKNLVDLSTGRYLTIAGECRFIDVTSDYEVVEQR